MQRASTGGAGPHGGRCLHDTAGGTLRRWRRPVFFLSRVQTWDCVKSGSRALETRLHVSKGVESPADAGKDREEVSRSPRRSSRSFSRAPADKTARGAASSQGQRADPMRPRDKRRQDRRGPQAPRKDSVKKQSRDTSKEPPVAGQVDKKTSHVSPVKRIAAEDAERMQREMAEATRSASELLRRLVGDAVAGASDQEGAQTLEAGPGWLPRPTGDPVADAVAFWEKGIGIPYESAVRALTTPQKMVPWQLVDGDALSAWVRNVQSRDELDWMNVRLIIRRLPCILTVTPATLAAASRAVSQMPAAKEVGFDLRQVATTYPRVLTIGALPSALERWFLDVRQLQSVRLPGEGSGGASVDVSWLADAVLRPSTWRTNPQVLRSTGKGIEKWLATVLGHRDHAQWLDLKNILRRHAALLAMNPDTVNAKVDTARKQLRHYLGVPEGDICKAINQNGSILRLSTETIVQRSKDMLEFVRYAGGLSRGEARAFILQYLKSPMTSYPVDKLQLKISRYRRELEPETLGTGTVMRMVLARPMMLTYSVDKVLRNVWALEAACGGHPEWSALWARWRVGQEDVGMLAWLVTMPEARVGRLAQVAALWGDGEVQASSVVMYAMASDAAYQAKLAALDVVPASA